MFTCTNQFCPDDAINKITFKNLQIIKIIGNDAFYKVEVPQNRKQFKKT